MLLEMMIRVKENDSEGSRILTVDRTSLSRRCCSRN